MSMLKIHSLTFTLSHSHTLALSLSHTLSFSHSLSLDMLNNFCFNVYVKKSLSLTFTLSHSHTLSISHSITLDMLNKFCFHLYAQKSLFIGENCNAFFFDSSITRSIDIRVHRAGSQLKMSESQTKAGNQKFFENVIIFSCEPAL